MRSLIEMSGGRFEPGKSRLAGFGSARGAVAIELAFLAPVLLALLLGAIDFGGLIHAKMQLASAARTGLEFAIQPGFNAQDSQDRTSLTTAMRSATSLDASAVISLTCECANGVPVVPGGDANDPAVQCSTAASGVFVTCTGGSLFVRVTVQDNFSTFVTYPLVTNPVAISADATIQVQ